ncbi:MAG TPA: glycosyltransferase family 2 protein [Stellaceae bacterium]|nr:glycosyltransferase family 2 protein [Stellaceae bacterium]
MGTVHNPKKTKRDLAPEGHSPCELTVVIPTFNEHDNIEPLVELITEALGRIEWEVIFVDDDSPDGTADAIRAIARCNARVRCLRRIGRRGLSSACIEGALASVAPFIAVMDADLQHDEKLLPPMLEILKHERCDVVVGSRYIAGGGVGDMSPHRVGISSLATRLSRLICKTKITDPMSGFFMMRREAFDGAVHRLSAHGFKILLDLLASSPEPMRVKELPYVFRQRRSGTSKLDTFVTWEFGVLLADKLVGHIVPVRFALFVFVGAFGLVVHLGVLRTTLTLTSLNFPAAQGVATLIAMTCNFLLNNLFTYYDQRLTRWRLMRGLFSFYVICSVGALGNVGIATYVFAADHVWWLAGIAGAVVGSVWNYAVSSIFTWKRH